MREYLTTIGSQHKWFQPMENIKVGDVVLIIEPDVPRRHWKLGQIEAMYPGRDGLVRTGGVVKRRSISRLSPLEAEVP